MKIRRGLTGSAVYTDIQIEKACQKLLFRITGDATILQIIALFSMIVTISIKAKGGQNENIATRMPMIALMEYAQFGEGKITLLQDTPSTTFTLCGEIDLSRAGNVFLNNNEYIAVTLSECRPDWIIDIDTFESNVSSMLYIKYNQSSINEKQMSQELPSNTADTILIRAENNPITSMEFTYANNLQTEFDTDTFKQIMEVSNDIAYVVKEKTSGSIIDTLTGYLNYIILDCNDVERINVSSTGASSTEIIAVEHKLRPQY
jgi:hypothetical protein